MKQFNFLLLICGLMLSMTVNAQRYLTPQFSTVSKTTVAYGANYTVLTLATTGHTFLQPLVMDVYTPDGDTEVERPVVMYYHTGNFLPNPQNGSTLGKRDDSSAVEVCTRLAKMGYVACSVDYRQGWNPLSADVDVRKGTLIGAAYRGIQDSRTAIRYIKKSFAEGANPFKVDTSRITLWGEGTGGYVTLGTATLDNFSDIFQSTKFFTASGIPMVIEAYNGDIYGTNAPTVCDAVYNFATGIPVGDTLSVPNHVGYSSAFQLCVNMGGALGDTLWLSDNDPPMISYHVPTDPFAPYNYGVLTVPTTGDLIVDVAGAYKVQEKVAQLGNNEIFADAQTFGNAWDVYSNAAEAATVSDATYNTYRNGLFPFVRPINTNPLNGQPAPESAPWAWWSEAFWSQAPHPSCPAGLPLDVCNFNVINEINAPFQGPDFARTYLDSVMGYFAPRACYALGLADCIATLDANNIKSEVSMKVMPNPTSGDFRIVTEATNPFNHIMLYDELGRLVASYFDVNTNDFTVQRNGLPRGMYVAQVKFADGYVTKKIMIQ